MGREVDQILHAAFVEVAAALRARIEPIVGKWDLSVRQVIPQMDRLTLEEMRDSFPKILMAVAAALESPDPEAIAGVVGESPAHGLARFYQHYGVVEVSQENRLLRGVIVLEVEDELGRQMTSLEAAALHATIDVMLLQAVMTLVEEKERHLRHAAERELKYLTFMSHDMNNHLGGVSLQLRLLQEELKKLGRAEQAEEAIDAALRGIEQTARGMRQLLDHERLRKGPTTASIHSVDLCTLLDALVREFSPLSRAKDVRLVVQAVPPCVTSTDPVLVSLVLRNLIGNAVKYTRRGSVRVGCQCDPAGEGRRWLLRVADDGPGIAPEHLGRIFEAFRRGDSHGQEGVGLGLAIAAQAARVLGAELTVQSTMGEGSTFSLRLPAEATRSAS